MLYIVTALKPEAQAFVDRYKLSKNRLKNFAIFTNPNMTLIISGLGVPNATLATQTLIDQYDITDEDIYINVGICGASKRYEIGELLKIGNIVYNSQTLRVDENSDKTIVCLDEETDTAEHDIVDMESFGFYDAVHHSPAIKNFHIFKVVSDHFQPDKVTKEGTKSLIFNAIDDINLIINQKAAQ